MTYNALNSTINFARPQHRSADVNSFDSQVHCDEMSFDKFTPEERAEFEAIHDEVDDDGQPSEYTEWQDFEGGDDWDQDQYDNYDEY